MESAEQKRINDLLNVIHGPHWYKCENAIDELKKIGSPTAIRALISLLPSQELAHEWERGELTVGDLASSSLVSLGEQAVDQLIDLFKNITPPYNDLRILIILTQIPDHRVLEVLLQVLVGSDWVLSNIAIRALYKFDDPRILEILINALQNEIDQIAHSAAHGLYEIADPRSVPALINALKHNYDYVQLWAVSALKKIGDKRAIEPLRKFIQQTEIREWVRAEAVKALYHLEHSE